MYLSFYFSHLINVCDYVKVVCVKSKQQAEPMGTVCLRSWAVWRNSGMLFMRAARGKGVPVGKKATEEEERGRKGKKLERKKLYVEHLSAVFRRRVRSACLSLRICLGERYANFLPSTRCSWFFIVTRVWRLPLLRNSGHFLSNWTGQGGNPAGQQEVLICLVPFSLRNKHFWVLGYGRLIYPHRETFSTCFFWKPLVESERGRGVSHNMCV